MGERKGDSELEKQTSLPLITFARTVKREGKFFFNEGNLSLFSVILNWVILC
jgi:hypothetical protein